MTNNTITRDELENNPSVDELTPEELEVQKELNDFFGLEQQENQPDDDVKEITENEENTDDTVDNTSDTDEDSDDDSEVEQNSDEQQKEQEQEDSTSSEQPGEKDTQKKTKQKRTSRSTKRIKGLVEDKKELTEQNTTLKTRNKDLEVENKELLKQLAEVRIAETDTSVETLKSKMIQAQDEGDTETFVSLSEQLQQKQLEKQTLTHTKETLDKETENEQSANDDTSQQRQTSSELRAELVEEFIEGNQWFITDDRKFSDDFDFGPEHVQATQIALEVNNMLLKDGWDDESDEFYTELNKRSRKLIKMKGLDKVLISNVELNQEQNSTDVESDNVSENNIQKSGKNNDKGDINSKSKPPVQKVQGSTRTSSTTSKQKESSNNTVVLGEVAKNMADALGMSYEDYAKMIKDAD